MSDTNNNCALTFRVKSNRFLKLVNHHLEFLQQAGGYSDVRWRDSNETGTPRQFVPFKTAVEVADALVFNLLHGVELELKASLIEAGSSKFGHNFEELIAELKKVTPQSPLLLAVNNCLNTIRCLAGSGGGIQSNGNETLADTKISQWYEDMRYPIRSKDKTAWAHPFQFLIADEQQWQNFSAAVSGLIDVQNTL